MYQRMAAGANIDDLIFQNIATGDVPAGYDRDTLLRHIHAHDGDKMLVGVEAFIAMWLRLPKFKYLAYAINWPIMRSITGLFYNLIIAPYLYRRYRRESCAIN